MDKELRILAANIVVESKLSSSVKRQFINFIKEAPSDSQVKALLMDGEIIEVNEEVEKLIDQRWKLSEAGGKIARARKHAISFLYSPAGHAATGAAQAATGAATVGAAAGGVVTGAALWALYRAIRGRYDVCTKKCGTFKINTSQRQLCMAKCKVTKLQGELNAAMKSKNKEEISKKKTALDKAKHVLARYQASMSGKPLPK